MMYEYRLPCNYCGNKHIITLFDEEYKIAHAHCSVCGADGPKCIDYSFNDRIDALPPDQIVLTEKWATQILLKLWTLDQRIERLIDNYRDSMRLFEKRIETIQKFQYKMQSLHGDTI